MSSFRESPSAEAGLAGGAVTTDTLLRGRVTLLQPARGFRSSLDPVLLAAFVTPPFHRFADIGCGTGALAFLLAAREPRATGVGVELQARLAGLASAGVARNDFAHRLQIVHGDVRERVGRAPLERGTFDLVVTNPPYRVLADGPASPDLERAQATHELSLRLHEWIDCAAALVAPGGRVAVVFPAERLDELRVGLRARGLAPARLRQVHPRVHRPASRVLVEARAVVEAGASGADAFVEPPLVLHEADGRHTPETLRILGEPAAAGG